LNLFCHGRWKREKNSLTQQQPTKENFKESPKIANSRKNAFDEEGIDLKSWQASLDQGQKRINHFINKLNLTTLNETTPANHHEKGMVVTSGTNLSSFSVLIITKP
jgi:hypothetical protein